MQESAALIKLASSIVDATTMVFGSRLGAIYAYGSGVDGSFIPDFSDLDLAIFCQGWPTLDDCLALHHRFGTLKPDPFAYLQVKYVNLDEPPEPQLVPGSFELLAGSLGDVGPYVFGDETLLTEAQRWLAMLPELVVGDAQTWSICIGDVRRRRQVRLITSRVKPAVRSMLATHGLRPTTAFAATWPEMETLMRSLDPTGASQIALLRSLLPPTDHAETVRAGELGLLLLWRLLSLNDQ